MPGRHVPERAFDCIENADAPLIRMQNRVEIIDISAKRNLGFFFGDSST